MITALLASLAVLALPQVLPLLALIGRRMEVVFLSVLCGGVVSGVAALLTLLVAGTPLVWYAVLCVICNAAAVPMLVRRRRDAASRSAAHARPALIACVLLAAAVAVMLIPQLVTPTADWDARSIWMLHARWLVAGHAYAATAIADPVFAFSHPDYPPLIPGAVAIAWQVAGHADLRLGQVLIGTLNGAACALVGAAVMRCAPRRLWWPGAVAGCAVAAAAVGAAGPGATDGYADLLAAAAVAGAVLFGLLAPRSRASLRLALLLALAAALTKNEGAVTGAATVVLVAVRYAWPGRRDLVAALRHGALIAAAGVVPMLLWPVAARLAGAHSDITSQSHIGALLTLQPEVVRRLTGAAADLVGRAPLLPIAAAVAVAGTLALAAARRRRRLGSSAWLWAVASASVASLVLVYAAGPVPLAQWLQTSAFRTTTLLRILLVADMGVWVVVAAADALAIRRPAQTAGAVAAPHAAAA